MPETPISTVSYQEFSQDPEAVIDKSNATGEATLVTRRGRLLFLIEPLAVEATTIEDSRQ